MMGNPPQTGNVLVKMATSDQNQNIFPQISGDVSEAEQKMDLKDKLSLIDKEIRQLYQFCVQEGFSPAQIEKCAQPLLDVGRAQKRKKWLKRLGCLVLFVAFIAGILMYGPAYNKVCIYAKLASLKILPYWDWRYIYEKDCLIDNPYSVQEAITEEECVSKCGDLRKIDRIDNADHSDMTDYLTNQRPVVITDATENWRARKEFSIEFIAKMFHETSTLKNAAVCQFQSTLEGYSKPGPFLSDLMQGKIQGSYQTYWENCGKEGAKVFRQFYRRPYFLPPMVESDEGNFLIVSSGGSKTLKVFWQTTVSWLSQITGQSRIILKPDPTCETACKDLMVMMKPGDSLVFSNELWTTSFKPVGNDPVIVIGSTGTTF